PRDSNPWFKGCASPSTPYSTTRGGGRQVTTTIPRYGARRARVPRHFCSRAHRGGVAANAPGRQKRFVAAKRFGYGEAAKPFDLAASFHVKRRLTPPCS